MSNSLAIATVTETLVQRLVEFLAEANGGTVPGARVTHLEPGSPELDTDQPGVKRLSLPGHPQRRPRQ